MSSGSESDEDYVPGKPEQVSEEGSADEETDLQYEKEQEHKAKKRKASQKNMPQKKTRTRAIEPVETVPTEVPNAKEEKKHEDDLWAKFLEGTDTKPKQNENVVKESNGISNEVPNYNNQNKESTDKSDKNKSDKSNDDNKAREKRIFEFAGETLIVENHIIKEKIKSTDSIALAKVGSSLPTRSSGGLSSILSNLDKKNKLSTLEKSKLDWETLKKEEGVEEEIQSYNKGKGGYLDRQDFLERSDYRQYEIERDIRLSRRSKR